MLAIGYVLGMATGFCGTALWLSKRFPGRGYLWLFLILSVLMYFVVAAT